MWKREYAQRRRERAASDPEYRERRRQQAKPADPEARRAYMREWNAANAEHVREYRRQRAAEQNARRRERYSSDPEHREACKVAARRVDPVVKRNGRLRAEYGITAADYDRMLAEQGGGCAICRRHVSADRRRLHVDHDHVTGRVRGILCLSCNHGLGKFGDEPERLRAAAAYLER